MCRPVEVCGGEVEAEARLHGWARRAAWSSMAARGRRHSGGARRLGGPWHGTRDARRGCGMRADQRRARRKAAVARLSGKEREDGGDARPEEVLTVVCTGTAVGPCVGPRDGARGDAMRCGQTVDFASVLSWCGGALFWPGSSGVCRRMSHPDIFEFQDVIKSKIKELIFL